MSAAVTERCRHEPGDRLSVVFDTPSGPRRFVGTVTDVDTLTFWVTWDDDRGRARYTLGADPVTLRAAPPGHELPGSELPGSVPDVATELTRLLDSHPDWPWRVRSVLQARCRLLDRRP